MGIETNAGAAPTPDDSTLIESTPRIFREAARATVSRRKAGHDRAWVSNAELAAEIRRLTGLREAGISEDRETEAALIATGHRQPTIDTETEHLRAQEALGGMLSQSARQARENVATVADRFGIDEPAPGYEDGRKELREATNPELENARAAARRRLGITDGADPPIADIVRELERLRAAPASRGRYIVSPERAQEILTGGERYRKRADIFAIRINETFSVVTEHGTMDAEAGDWLATNDASVDPSSDAWPISAARFEASYVPAVGVDDRVIVNRFLWAEERIYHAISVLRHGRGGLSDSADERFARDLVLELTGLDDDGRPRHPGPAD